MLLVLGERDLGLVHAASHAWLVSQHQDAQTTQKPEVQSERTFPALLSIAGEEAQNLAVFLWVG